MGVFVVGAILAFVSRVPKRCTVSEIARRYRFARRHFRSCTMALPALLAFWPLLNALDSVLAWLLWGASMVTLYTDSSLVHHQLTSWKCPHCQGKYGYPGLIRDLWRGGRYGCSHCGSRSLA